MRRSRLAAVALLALGGLLSACNPACERVCRKALSCDLTPRLAQADCEESCNRQEALYDIWQDEAKIESFDAHKRCVLQATCDELDDGVCYDDEIYLF